MNFVELLQFLPLIIGAFLAYQLIFKRELPEKGLLNILTYFIGIIIVFVAVSWLTTTFLADWANDLLNAGSNGTEWEQFIQNSEGVVDDAFTDPGDVDENTVIQQDTPVQVVVTATPVPGDVNARQLEEARGPTTYTVVAGDTLTKIARRYGVTVQAIQKANNIPEGQEDNIRVGDQLIIPAAP